MSSKGVNDKFEKFFKKRTAKENFSEIENWYLISNKHHIMSYKQYNISKVEELYVNDKLNIKQLLMLINEAKKIL